MPIIAKICLTACLLTALYFLYQIFEHRVLLFTHTKIDLGLNKKACVITDLHNCKLSDRVVRKIEKEAPDFIFLAGDMITDKAEKQDHALNAIKALVSIAPVYYSFGNHELKFKDNRPDAWNDFLNRLPDGCVLMDKNMQLEIADDIELYAINLRREIYKKGRVYDISGEQTKIFDPVSHNKKKILLAHNPDFYDYYKRVVDADLTISGHLHGGLVRLPFIGGLLFGRIIIVSIIIQFFGI